MKRRLLFINEFFHPDIVASAVVATEQWCRIAALRPDWQIVVIAGNRAWDDPTRVYPAEETVNGVQVIRVERPVVSRISLFRRALGFAAFQRNAIRAAKSLDRVDLVMATTAPPQGGSIASRIAAAHGCPFIYKVLDLYPDLAATLGRLRGGGFVFRRWLKGDTKCMRQAAKVVSIGERMTQRIAATRDVEPAKLATIHDGFDPDRLAFEGPNRFAAEHNTSGRFVVQYAGNMGLSHPFETIIAAARLLATQSHGADPASADRNLAANADIAFQFIGDGPQRAYIAANLPPGAELIGYQPAAMLGQVLAAADVALISQHAEMYDEALPYKIYATLAAGKPVVLVGSAKSEIAAWLAESGAGVQIDHGDAAALAATLSDLRSDAAKRSAMARAARQRFDERFGADKVAAAWVAMIESVM